MSVIMQNKPLEQKKVFTAANYCELIFYKEIKNTSKVCVPDGFLSRCETCEQTICKGNPHEAKVLLEEIRESNKNLYTMYLDKYKKTEEKSTPKLQAQKSKVLGVDSGAIDALFKRAMNADTNKTQIFKR